jgi:prepilin-type N-terminal cleavage/methylation domain-containing protein
VGPRGGRGRAGGKEGGQVEAGMAHAMDLAVGEQRLADKAWLCARAGRRVALASACAHGFTLIEALVVVAVIALLIGVLLPALSAGRDAARTAVCCTNQRQLVLGWSMYAMDYADRAMPLAYWSAQDVGQGEAIYWWGSHGTMESPPDHQRGFLAPYLDSDLRDGSVYECPNQPWGTYRPQGPSRSITSTYGYNGYYLSPAKTPGWAFSIGHRPWRRVSEIDRPTQLMVFADTLLPGPGGIQPANCALLDPPRTFSASGGGTWNINPNPTTAFRHGRGAGSRAAGAAVAAFADGHVGAIKARPEWLTHPDIGVGSVGGVDGLGPSYVPDWERWSQP